MARIRVVVPSYLDRLSQILIKDTNNGLRTEKGEEQYCTVLSSISALFVPGGV